MPFRSPTHATRAARARRPIRRRLAATVAAVSVAAVTVACGPTPDQDAFYTPPNPLPAVANGSVLRSRAAVFTLDPIGKAPVAGVRSSQVMYRSTDAANRPIALVGTVLVPTAPWTGPGQRPLVSIGVGTRGVGDACAPSYTLSEGTDYEAATVKSLTDRGWAVAVTDYQGLGTPGGHTYMVGRAQGRAVLDMARAAIRLPGSGLDANTPVGISGYSQGGAAAGWAAELAPTYAPELKLKGVAAGGVPADLLAVANSLDGGPFVAFALLAALGYDSAYPELDLESYLNTRGQDLVADADDLCLVSIDGFSQFLGTAFSRLSDYTTTNPLQHGTWQARLDTNRLGATRPTVPVFQYHGFIDDIIPFAQAQTLRNDWCARGANVTWSVQVLSNHVGGLLFGQASANDFLAARFAGTPVTGNC